MKLDARTANAIAQGRVTAVLRTRRLERTREPVQFERERTADDAAPKHAEDTTVIDTKCYVQVLNQVHLALGELDDKAAKKLGHRSLFMLKQEMGDDFKPGRQMWLVTVERHDADEALFLAPVSGYTKSRHMSVDPDAEIVPPSLLKDVNDRRRNLRGLWERERQVILGSLGRLTADAETRLACQREIRALQRQLDALDRKLQSAA